MRDRQDDIREKMVRDVPDGAPVVASFDFLSHLANRRELYAFYNVWLGKNLFTGKTFFLPDTVRYALIDFSDPWLKNAYQNTPQEVDKNIRSFLNKKWKVLNQSGGIQLLYR